jgi:hypothetical protein
MCIALFKLRTCLMTVVFINSVMKAGIVSLFVGPTHSVNVWEAGDPICVSEVRPPTDILFILQVVGMESHGGMISTGEVS